MSNYPSSFAEWQNYPSKLDPIVMVDEIPKLGSGKTDFWATKKIALDNEQK
jgi:hypothetical protein